MLTRSNKKPGKIPPGNNNSNNNNNENDDDYNDDDNGEDDNDNLSNGCDVFRLLSFFWLWMFRSDPSKTFD